MTLSSSKPETRRDEIESALQREGLTCAARLAERLDADMARALAGPGHAVSAAEICTVLNQSLADCIDLEIQCRQARWQSTAAGACRLAERFGEIARQMARHEDDLAERIVTLGGIVEGTLGSICQRSGLNEYPTRRDGDSVDLDTVISALGVISVSVAHEANWLHTLDDADSARILAEIGRSAEGDLSELETMQRG